jgi:hypothetical protein
MSTPCYIDVCDTYERCTVLVYSFDALQYCVPTVKVLAAACVVMVLAAAL